MRALTSLDYIKKIHIYKDIDTDIIWCALFGGDELKLAEEINLSSDFKYSNIPKMLTELTNVDHIRVDFPITEFNRSYFIHQLEHNNVGDRELLVEYCENFNRASTVVLYNSEKHKKIYKVW